MVAVSHLSGDFFPLRYIFLEDNDFLICYISMESFRIVLFASDVFRRLNDIYLKLEWKGNEDIKFQVLVEIFSSNVFPRRRSTKS